MDLDVASDKFEGDSELTDETTLSNGIQDSSPDEEQTLPILQKVINLSARVQVYFDYYIRQYLI